MIAIQDLQRRIKAFTAARATADTLSIVDFADLQPKAITVLLRLLGETEATLGGLNGMQTQEALRAVMAVAELLNTMDWERIKWRLQTLFKRLEEDFETTMEKLQGIQVIGDELDFKLLAGSVTRLAQALQSFWEEHRASYSVISFPVQPPIQLFFQVWLFKHLLRLAIGHVAAPSPLPKAHVTAVASSPHLAPVQEDRPADKGKKKKKGKKGARPAEPPAPSLAAPLRRPQPPATSEERATSPGPSALAPLRLPPTSSALSPAMQRRLAAARKGRWAATSSPRETQKGRAVTEAELIPQLEEIRKEAMSMMCPLPALKSQPSVCLELARRLKVLLSSLDCDGDRVRFAMMRGIEGGLLLRANLQTAAYRTLMVSILHRCELMEAMVAAAGRGVSMPKGISAFTADLAESVDDLLHAMDEGAGGVNVEGEAVEKLLRRVLAATRVLITSDYSYIEPLLSAIVALIHLVVPTRPNEAADLAEEGIRRSSAETYLSAAHSFEFVISDSLRLQNQLRLRKGRMAWTESKVEEAVGLVWIMASVSNSWEEYIDCLAEFTKILDVEASEDTRWVLAPGRPDIFEATLTATSVATGLPRPGTTSPFTFSKVERAETEV